MTVRFFCPHCNKPLEVDNDDAGKAVMCFYCEKQVTAPQASDPKLAKPGEPVAEPQAPKKSSALGIVGLLAALALILVFIGIVGWVTTSVLPVARQPGFTEMTQLQQQELVQKKMQDLAAQPAALIGRIAMLTLALLSFGASLAAIIKNAGRKFAVPGLIISLLFLLPFIAGTILKLLR